MKTNLLVLFASTTLLCACGNTNQEQTSNASITSNDTNIVRKSSKKMNQEDRLMFFNHAAIGGMMEVEASNLLLKNARSDSHVVAHATMIKNDHVKANAELKAIAAKESFALPTLLPDSKMKQLKQMEGLNDEAQNEFYINLMIAEHNEAIDLFSLASRMEDQPIANFAKKTLPILRHHYEMTVSLKDKIVKNKTGQGDDLLKISDKTDKNPQKNKH